MKYPRRIKDFLKNFQGISTVFFLTYISVLFGFFSLIPKITDINSFLSIFIVISIAFILLAFGIEFKKSFNRLGAWDYIITEYFGYAWKKNKYFQRSRHFVEEKSELADTLVTELFPWLIQKIHDTYGSSIETIRIILDSGSTITPIFSFLVRYGTSAPAGCRYGFEFYTNNLAGIDEIHRIPTHKKDRFSETDFNLIGGQPLNQYRATTGNFSNRILKELLAKKKDGEEKILNIGIMTSNWLLCQRALDKIMICARGRGHLEFKEILVENCDYLILVAPLGKVLPMENVELFNSTLKIDPKDEENRYKGFEIPVSMKHHTFLHTSYRRGKSSSSPLKFVSARLKDINVHGGSKNFQLSPVCPKFDRRQNQDEAIRMDLPHEYIHANFKDIYGYEIP